MLSGNESYRKAGLYPSCRLKLTVTAKIPHIHGLVAATVTATSDTVTVATAERGKSAASVVCSGNMIVVRKYAQ